MRGTKNHKNLGVWQLAIELVCAIYSATSSFPKREIYGITAQMRKAAVSIPCSIAEGRGRRSNAEFRRFLLIALGSTVELETQVILCRVLGFLAEREEDELTALTERVQMMLHKLRASLTEGNRRQTP